jgi:DNA mismatch repair ATPase MutS
VVNSKYLPFFLGQDVLITLDKGKQLYMITYLLVIVFIFIAFILLSRFTVVTRRRRMLAQLVAGWGKPKTDYFNFDEIGIYSKADPAIPFHELSAQTRADLDFEELFTFVDRTTSKVGQQFLYNRLAKPCNDITELQQLGTTADFFAANRKIREDVQELLLSLNHSGGYYIATLFNPKLAERPKWFPLLMIDTVAVVLMLLLSPRYPVLLVWMMVPFTLNMGLHFWNKNNIYRFIRSLPQLNKMLKVTGKLVEKDIPVEKRNVKEALSSLKTFQRKMRLVSFGQQGIAGEMSQVFYYFLELVKAIFLIELHTFYSIMKELENKRESVRDVFVYAGWIDTAISVASLRSGYMKTCVPEFTGPEKRMELVKAYHPLIEDCVTNDLSVDSKSILITGSNMSGKTTFLRTVAINSILAQTLYTCFAERFSSPILKTASSIRIDDSVADGKSYYLAEVDTMGKLIDAVAQPDQHLFILDEVFKGTNTVERIAAGKAILSYLNRNNNIVLVSTHDMELSGMLVSEYDLYHFVETIQDNQLFFDHLLKEGELKTRNAIRILEMSDYPEAIVEEAKKISRKIAAGPD